MRNKMITLCPTTYETAQKMDNFSAWVRQKLIDHNGKVYEEMPASIKIKYSCKLCGLNYTRPFKQIWNCESCYAELTEGSI